MYKKQRLALKKKAVYKKKYAVPRVLLNKEMGHRHIVTSATSTQTQLRVITPSSGVSIFEIGTTSSANLALSFSLGETIINLGGVPTLSVPNPALAELQNLYDSFQIEKVEITVFSGCTQSLTSGESFTGSGYVLPLIGCAPDTDDAANTSLTQLQQYSTFKCFQLGQIPMKVSVVPCCAGALSSTGQTRLQKQDLNTQYPNVPHYGYKMAIDGFKSTPGVTNTLLSMQFRVHYLMKATR